MYPERELDLFAVHFHYLDLKVDACAIASAPSTNTTMMADFPRTYRDQMLILKLVVGKTNENRRLADSAVADQQQFENKLLLGHFAS